MNLTPDDLTPDELSGGILDAASMSGRFMPLTCGFLVELRGFEPLTPTLPGESRSRDQAR